MLQPSRTIQFQSLRGFGVGWSPHWDESMIAGKGFQSLRGFGVGWSYSDGYLMPVETLFQSLRGFGVGWSLKPSAQKKC